MVKFGWFGVEWPCSIWLAHISRTHEKPRRSLCEELPTGRCCLSVRHVLVRNCLWDRPNKRVAGLFWPWVSTWPSWRWFFSGSGASAISLVHEWCVHYDDCRLPSELVCFEPVVVCWCWLQKCPEVFRCSSPTLKILSRKRSPLQRRCSSCRECDVEPDCGNGRICRFHQRVWLFVESQVLVEPSSETL